MDDAEATEYNVTLVLEGQPLLEIDRHRGVYLGTSPQSRHLGLNHSSHSHFSGQCFTLIFKCIQLTL